jgi:hypothetical protein
MVKGYGVSANVKEILILFVVVIGFILLLPKLIKLFVKSSVSEASDLLTDLPLPEFGLSEYAERLSKLYETNLQTNVDRTKPIDEIIHETAWVPQIPGVTYLPKIPGVNYLPELGITEKLSEVTASTGKYFKLPEFGLSEWFERF